MGGEKLGGAEGEGNENQDIFCEEKKILFSIKGKKELKKN